MWRQFKDSVLRDNVVDLAVGFIMEASFSNIVSSPVNDVLMPPIGLALGRVASSNLPRDLSGGGYSSLAQAQDACATTINYAVFLNTVMEFLIIAGALFLLILQLNRLQRQPEASPSTKQCPDCLTAIPISATR